MNNEEAKNPTPIQDPPNAGEAQAFVEPESLEDALQMFNKSKQEPAQEPLPMEEPVGKHAKQPEPAGEPEPVPDAGAEDSIADAPQDTGGAGDQVPGGLPDAGEGIDWSAREQELNVDLQNEAKRRALEICKQEGAVLIDVNRLATRDENGTIRFFDPDSDPDNRREFASRAEAQAWVDAWNNGVRAEYNKQVMNEYTKLVQGSTPQRQVMRFAKEYEAMPDNVKQIFDALIDDYAVTDNAGNIVGFNVNLESMATKAYRIAQLSPQAAQQQQQPDKQEPAQDDGPAMDLKSGSSESGVKDPKTLEEAMLLLRDSKKEG